MAGADILPSAGVIRLRIDREQYEDVPIEANTGFPRINMLQEDDTEDQKASKRKACLNKFLEEHGIDPEKWDNYASKHQEETLVEDSAFQDLSSIESLPCLSKEAHDEINDEFRDGQPEEAEPFDPAWIGILQKDRLECSLQEALKLPMRTSFLLEDSASSSEGVPEDIPESFPEGLLEDIPEGYSSAADSEAFTEDTDAAT